MEEMYGLKLNNECKIYYCLWVSGFRSFEVIGVRIMFWFYGSIVN